MSTVSRPTKLCCKTFIPKGLVYGVHYPTNIKSFPPIFKKIYNCECPKKNRRLTNVEDNGMISSEDLLQRKRLKIDDMNYNTQDKEYNQNFDNNTLGVEIEGRPSNAMQTQTLIMPFSERDAAANNQDVSDEILHNRDDQSLNEENEVDHRFESEEDVNNKKEEVKEEVMFQTPQKMGKLSSPQDSDLKKNLDETQRVNNQSLASGSKNPEEQDDIKDFIDE